MFDFSFLDEFKRMNKRQVYYQVLNFAMIVSTALMIWKGLMVVTGSESPIVVVLRLFNTPNISIYINNSTNSD